VEYFTSVIFVICAYSICDHKS